MSKDNVQYSSDIKVSIGLGEDKMPVKIKWEADDNPNGNGPQECKAILLSFFDGDHQETLKIDLWTKEMKVNEMDRFMYQTLRGMTDTYFRATNNKELASQMQQFVQYFGEKTEVVTKGK